MRAGSAFLHKILGNWEHVSDAADLVDGVEGCNLKKMTRNQLHDMVLGLREMGRKYCKFPSPRD
jgi:hypothetical protein